MSDQTLRKIWICTDVCMDILHFFDRPQLGLKLALISDRFDVLVDAHFDAKSELTVWRDVEICKDTESEDTILHVYMSDGVGFSKFALPDSPLPNKIRFRELYIIYIDLSVIAFLHANPHVFNKTTYLHVEIVSLSPTIFNRIYQQVNSIGSHCLLPDVSANDGPPTQDVEILSAPDVRPIWDIFMRQIWPIFGTNIRHLDTSPRGVYLENFVRLISPTIFSDLAQLNSIKSWVMVPDVIADDGPNATPTAGQVLSKWLHTPSKDGQPKQLRCLHDITLQNCDWINSFKETFLRATTTTDSPSVSYQIHFRFNGPTPIVPFELVNERTQEKLTLEEEAENDFGSAGLLLKRCPILRGTAPAFQWEDKNLYTRVSFSLVGGDNHYGWPLCLSEGQTSNSAELN